MGIGWVAERDGEKVAKRVVGMVAKLVWTKVALKVAGMAGMKAAVMVGEWEWERAE